MNTTTCYCESPTFDPDYAFEDGEGFQCVECDSNVYYLIDGEDRDAAYDDNGCWNHADDNCTDPECIRRAGGSVLASELRQAERLLV